MAGELKLKVTAREAKQIRENCYIRDVMRLLDDRDAMLAEIDRLNRSIEFTQSWYGELWNLLRKLFDGTELEKPACDIMANGTAALALPENAYEAAIRDCISALDVLLGDSDLPDDDRPGVLAMQRAMALLNGTRV